MIYQASAPGSLMLLGEYAVLQHYSALLTAINKRLTVTLTPHHNDQIIIQSALGEHCTTLQTLTPQPPFQFVLGVLQHYQAQLSQGCVIHIHTDFSPTMGLGSSAAITVAMLAVLQLWLGAHPFTDHHIATIGQQIIQHIQGVGSGADVAASVYGGLIAYQASPLQVEKISHTYPLTVRYSGTKTPTAIAIHKVNQQFAKKRDAFQALMQRIGASAQRGIEQARLAQWQALGHSMNEQQIAMHELGVNTTSLQTLIDQLQSESTILGVKISGAGLGDCVVGLGSSRHNPLAIAMSGTGLLYECL